jgi:hypothetical protein
MNIEQCLRSQDLFGWSLPIEKAARGDPQQRDVMASLEEKSHTKKRPMETMGPN